MTDRPAVVWFRQDLWTTDRPALVAAAEGGQPVLPLYVLDDQSPGAPRHGRRQWRPSPGSPAAGSPPFAQPPLLRYSRCVAFLSHTGQHAPHLVFRPLRELIVALQCR